MHRLKDTVKNFKKCLNKADKEKHEMRTNTCNHEAWHLVSDDPIVHGCNGRDSKHMYHGGQNPQCNMPTQMTNIAQTCDASKGEPCCGDRLVNTGLLRVKSTCVMRTDVNGIGKIAHDLRRRVQQEKARCVYPEYTVIPFD